ncbi:hypothetical protein [Pedobacter paludis]|uniref:Uncharacterized protein n=1 Tax=Pedobacter paludis TaxID=2203212 RepID=A0A317F2E0_9SPHI|nr:hypothetical protein [Pedobacter paludis]PWS33334.1 hypothetical protein DF947_01535 [Pedobacter paludis]
MSAGNSAGAEKNEWFMDALKMLSGPYGWMLVLGLSLALLVLVWYLLRKDGFDGSGLVKGKRALGDGGRDLDAEVLDGYTHLMGKAKPEPGVSVVSADDFGFSDQVSADQLGLLSDAQQEIREICQFLSDSDGQKEDFFIMFASLREKYPRMTGHPLRASLEHFIREQVPFFLSSAELASLWD